MVLKIWKKISKSFDFIFFLELNKFFTIIPFSLSLKGCQHHVLNNNQWWGKISDGIPTPTERSTSQCCTAVLIDTCTAVARFLSQFWGHTHIHVAYPLGLGWTHTHTHTTLGHGCRFSGVGVQVALKTPELPMPIPKIYGGPRTLVKQGNGGNQNPALCSINVFPIQYLQVMQMLCVSIRNSRHLWRNCKQLSNNHLTFITDHWNSFT